MCRPCSGGAVTQTGLSPAKQALLAQRLRGKRDVVAIPPRLAGTAPPLSPAQERLWFLEQYAPGTAAYTVTFAARLGGELDEAAFERALRAVAARHESLRTRFVTGDDGAPEVVVDAEPRVGIEWTDGSEQELTALVRDAAARPFDLATGPLFRALMVRLGPADHAAVLTMHHTVTDGWSFDILVEEVLALHHAYRTGAEPALAPVPVQYGDYALWQRGRSYDGDLRYWTERLAGVPPLDLPADRPRPATQGWAGAGHGFALGTELSEAVAALGRSHGATPYMTLLAAYQLLLGRHSGQEDFAVGSPVSGRGLPELERCVGVFINTLPMRADLSGDPTFAELLNRVRETALDAFDHQELPFDQLVNALGVERDVSRSPVFQAMFALQNYRSAALRSPGLTMTPMGAETTVSRFDLALYLFEMPDGLAGTFTYGTALFEPATIERMAARFERLLASIVAAPDARISELDMVPEDELAQVVAYGESEPVNATGLVHDAIAARAARSPKTPAVVWGNATLTYRELDERADRLARRLVALGAGRDQRVAICLEQSLELAVAVLGVLKSGAAYLPLDPEHPRDRLAYVLEDAAATLVITEPALRDRLPDSITVVPVDGEPVTQELPQAEPDDLAYVIYTSGTTGRPKGVGLQHREVITYLSGVRERLAVGEGGNYGLPQSLAFDFGVTIFYQCLTSGGTLHLIPSRATGPEFAEICATAGIDVIKLTPSHLAALLSDTPAEEILPRRLLILGGEAAPSEWARELAAAGRCRVLNHYGPTEATVGVTTYEVLAEERAGGKSLPIGRPMPGATVRVLDRHLRPVPVGVPGEVYLGGRRLARGYLNRPGLTGGKFIPDPYGEPGARMYHTGDLGRWLPSGELEFLGRTDFQVKIRGYRVEPAEIEAVLGALPEVAQAVVELRGDRLVAYLVPTGEPVGPAEMRAALSGDLPEYMIPSRFVWLAELPLKSHGKVDRSALPEPAPETAAEGYVPPEPGSEETVATIWSDLLEVERVGALDDFFALGGHSLLAMKVIARLRKAVPERTVTVLDLFQHRTVRELAHLLDTGDSGPRRLLHRLTPARAATTSLVCVPYGGGSAVIFQPLADVLPDSWALHSVAVPGHELGEEARPLPEVARECAEEILEGIQGPLVLYGHCGLGVMLTVEIARRLEAAGRTVDAIYLGGIFPFAKPGRSMSWFGDLMDKLAGDQARINALTAAGLDVDDVGRDQLKLIVQNRRTGTREAERFFTRLFAEPSARVHAPIISVVGERDPATEFYQERYREWRHLTGTAACAVLDEAGHFFLKWRAAELAEIVTSAHVAVAAGATAPLEHHDPAQTWWLLPPERAQEPPERPDEPTEEPVEEPAGQAPAAIGPRPSMRRFLVVAAGQLVSITGSALTEFAIPLWIYLNTGSLVRFALFAVLGLLPGMLIAPLAGTIVDRYDRRKVMLAGDAAAGGVQLVLGVLLWTGNLQIWHVYPLLVCLSIALTFQRFAYQSAIPQLVPKRFLGHANGVVQMATGTAQLIVPLIAVGLMAAIGLEGILVLDVASYATATLIVLLVRFPRTMAWKRRETVMAEMINGIRYSWGNRGFRAMLGYFAVLNIFLSPLFLMISPLVLAFAKLPDVGRVSFAGGLGVFLAGFVMAAWGGPRRRRLRGVLLATLALSVFCVVTGLQAELWLIAAGAFGMSFCLTLLNGVYATIIQVKVPQRFHGRVIALNTLVAWSTLPIGFGLVAPYAAAVFEPLMASHGPLASTVGAVLGVGAGRGIGFMYACFGVAIAVVALVGLRVGTLARFDDEVPDAPPDDLVGLEAVRDRR
ncbi:amino acid adenylation domain-containing protein [Streptosporangiaceae bacterium NEAU-GS5]|nr:amino acid adenylation domain-containing protein [Streptosporangiaceae bacterium NEAU-GS5]